MSDSPELQGRVAFITGGATGLGLEMAKTFGRRGAKLVLASRDEAHLEAGEEELRSEGIETLTIPLDVREARSVRAAVKQAHLHFGSLDILVNNAAGNFVRPAERLPEKAFANIVDIVVNGTFYASRAAGNLMIAQGRGVILNIVATYAWTGGPGTVHSATAKAGVLAMTRTLAVEWARHGVRVNAIAPGAMETGGASARLWPSDELEERVRSRVPLGRFATLEEVAHAAGYLVSDQAAYITGECLTIDGGAWLGRGVLDADPEQGILKVIRRQ
ncbi:MAG: SDR family oxidoreductase [Planctomycetota bacterium]